MDNRFEDFTSLLSRSIRCINKIKNYEMKQFGLKGTQVNCLFYLSHTNGLTATEIVNLSGEDKAAASRTIKELEEKGYVLCENNSEKKKYNAQIILTEKGKKTAEKINAIIKDIIDYDTSYISDEDLKNFYSTFNKIYQNLRNISNSCGDSND